MKMRGKTLSCITSRYFDSWLCRDTWDTHHPMDRARFYRFVKAVARYNRQAPSSSIIHDAIINQWKRHRRNAKLQKEAEHYAELYETLISYERTKGFPDPLIECRDIVQYHLRLKSAGGSNELYQRMMVKVWGPDWRMKLEEALNNS